MEVVVLMPIVCGVAAIFGVTTLFGAPATLGGIILGAKTGLLIAARFEDGGSDDGFEDDVG